MGNQPPRTIGSAASDLLKKAAGGHHDVKVSPRDWRMLWLWIESGAPYAGTYAALRNEKEQVRANLATANALLPAVEVLRRRCGSCHDVGGRKPDSRLPLPFNPQIRRQKRQALGRRTAIHERIVLEDDPVARYSAHVLLNFSRPHLSPLLLGPLAKEAGGYGSCGAVFRDRGDPDYARILEAIRAAKEKLDVEPRFSTPGFRPNRQYVREMKRFGVLPESFDLNRDTLDVFETDQRYWKSLWSSPRPPS